MSFDDQGIDYPFSVGQIMANIVNSLNAHLEAGFWPEPWREIGFCPGDWVDARVLSNREASSIVFRYKYQEPDGAIINNIRELLENDNAKGVLIQTKLYKVLYLPSPMTLAQKTLGYMFPIMEVDEQKCMMVFYQVGHYEGEHWCHCDTGGYMCCDDTDCPTFDCVGCGSADGLISPLDEAVINCGVDTIPFFKDYRPFDRVQVGSNLLNLAVDLG